MTAALSSVDAGAAVFPVTEPEGYRDANDAVLKACSGQLVAFCRVAPEEPGEARRCRGRGRGIKLHPAGDKFELDDDRLTEVFGLAWCMRARASTRSATRCRDYFFAAS